MRLGSANVDAWDVGASGGYQTGMVSRLADFGWPGMAKLACSSTVAALDQGATIDWHRQEQLFLVSQIRDRWYGNSMCTRKETATSSNRSSGRQPQSGVPERGIGQLSLVEHALCPLDAARSPDQPFAHECEYLYSDDNRRRRAAQVRVTCPLGLSPLDEFYLWGLLALALAQPEPDVEFHATRHYCLKNLGVIDQHSRRGGRQYRQFSEALQRLSMVRYQNDAFYDPLRGERRRVSFGLFSYSLPVDTESSRVWRIVWDPLFFELVAPVGGYLRFDLGVYRDLDPASRRLFLLVSKIFRRRRTSPVFDLRHLGVDVLGFSPSLATRDLKSKVSRCVSKLTTRGIVGYQDREVSIMRKSVGKFVVTLRRGPYFEHRGRKDSPPQCRQQSALADLLRRIGIEERAISRLLQQHPARLLREWIDITLAAEERFGDGFFRRSPAAFFVDNVQNAATGNRTPPDWWHDLKRAERRARAQDAVARAQRQGHESNGRSVSSEDALREALRVQFEVAGQPSDAARKNAARFSEEFGRTSDGTVDEATERLLRVLS